MGILATFDPKLLTLRDHARNLLGDRRVDPDTKAILLDDTYDGMLEAYPYSIAVGLLADSILSEVAQEPDRIRELAGNSYEWNHRLEGWAALSARGASGKIPTPNAAAAEEADDPAPFRTVQLGTRSTLQ